MSQTSRVRLDKRKYYSRDQIIRHAQKYPTFHWPTTELLLNLVYAYDLIATYTTRILNRYHLSLSAFNLLIILARSEGKGLPLHEIGEALLVSRANVTGLVDCLERRGLVGRVAHAEDRRVRIVRITKSGEELLESILPGYHGEVRELVNELSDEEKAQLSQLLLKLQDSILHTLEKKSKKREDGLITGNGGYKQ